MAVASQEMPTLDVGTGSTTQATYEIIERDILLIRNAFSYGKVLIDTALPLISLWRKAGIVGNDGAGYDTKTRRCAQLSLSGKDHPCLETFEAALCETIGAALGIYVKHNPFVLVTEDLGYSLVRYEIGDFFTTHADSRPGPTVHSGRRLSVLAYPNDDYEGGELNFPRQGFCHKPSAGDVVLFPSFYTHPHESRPVTKGRKFAITSWLY